MKRYLRVWMLIFSLLFAIIPASAVSATSLPATTPTVAVSELCEVVECYGYTCQFEFCACWCNKQCNGLNSHMQLMRYIEGICRDFYTYDFCYFDGYFLPVGSCYDACNDCPAGHGDNWPCYSGLMCYTVK